MKTHKKRAIIYTEARDISQAFELIESAEKYCAENNITVLKSSYDYFGSPNSLFQTLDILIQYSRKSIPIDYLIIPTKEIKGFSMNILLAVLSYCSTELLIVE